MTETYTGNMYRQNFGLIRLRAQYKTGLNRSRARRHLNFYVAHASEKNACLETLESDLLIHILKLFSFILFDFIARNIQRYRQE